MNTEKLRDWLQIGGLFGVIASLVFVGLQMKLDRQIALSGVISVAAESSKYWAELVNSNADIWVDGLAGGELNPVEFQRFNALADAFFLRWQAAWTRAGELAPSLRNRFSREAALYIHGYPGLEAYWVRRMQWESIVNNGSSIPWSVSVEDQLRSLRSND